MVTRSSLQRAEARAVELAGHLNTTRAGLAIQEKLTEQAEVLLARHRLVLEKVLAAIGNDQAFYMLMTPPMTEHEAKLLIREVDAKYGTFAYHVPMSPVELRFEQRPPGTIPGRLRTRVLEMVRFGLSLSLSPEVPPEAVAGQVAEQVRRAVLSQWKSQTVLKVPERFA